MSSTDCAAARIAALFDERLVPAAEAMRKRGGSYFELAPSTKVESYFVKRARTALSQKDFEWPVVRTPEELTQRLRELWSQDPELAQLVEQLARLARIPDAIDGESTLSELVYPMY